MNWSAWASFGLGATVALTGIMMFSQLAGLSRMDIPMLLGSIFVEDPDKARVLGFVMHLANGQLFALVYLLAFESLGYSNWWLGALFGLSHGMAALTVLLPVLPGIHPRMASSRTGPDGAKALEPPGLLGLNYGSATPITTLVAHAVYGLILGAFLTPS